MPIKKKLGQLLVESGMLDEYQLKSALGFQRKWGGRLGKVLVDNHFVTEEALVQVLKQQTGLAVVELEQRTIPAYLLALVPFEVAEANNLIPVVLEGGPGLETLVVAMSDPTNLIILDELRARTGKRVRPVIGSEGAIGRAIVRCYRGRAGPGQALPSSTELPPPVLDGEPDMVLVQGRLEAPPLGAAQPGGLTDAVDPFAELDVLAQSRRPSATGLQPVPAPPPAAPDPLTGFEPLPQLHPAATPFDLGGSVDVLLDDLPGGGGARPPVAGAPPPPPTAGAPEETVEELELVEDIEEIGRPAQDQVTPVPGPAPAPPASIIVSPDFFSGEGARLPPELAEAFAADALEAVGELQSSSGGAPAPPDLGQPADLSDVPDLDLPTPPSAGPALESPSEPMDLSMDGEAEEPATGAGRDREPTVVSRVSAQMARGLEAQRGIAEAVSRPAPAPSPAVVPQAQVRPAARPAPAAGVPSPRPVPAVPPVAAPPGKSAQSAVPTARPRTGSGKAAPGSPAMQALLAKFGIRKGAEEPAGPLLAAQPAPQAPPSLPAPPQASLDTEPPDSRPREAPTVIRTVPAVQAEEGTQPRALTLADPVLRALIKVLADKGLVTEREIIEELLRG